eukprot:CAMPEP_0202906212 /NCGR_PEP_ID=MMETSP1392-20130828/37797_1 /ASSEMBLY_ACC=CAM_ASM_000868 /TAXON_ID=225041 /ORGANISM="Chlamydomonas chlamydogama, Strain SAG 11-48b" /LENGTH=85 /DNA_ID=CAMNT_0049594609 /DNA_START=439 /DNA_END=696 /DNA_ORIENTATION=-
MFPGSGRPGISGALTLAVWAATAASLSSPVSTLSPNHVAPENEECSPQKSRTSLSVLWTTVKAPATTSPSTKFKDSGDSEESGVV